MKLELYTNFYTLMIRLEPGTYFVLTESYDVVFALLCMGWTGVEQERAFPCIALTVCMRRVGQLESLVHMLQRCYSASWIVNSIYDKRFLGGQHVQCRYRSHSVLSYVSHQWRHGRCWPRKKATVAVGDIHVYFEVLRVRRWSGEELDAPLYLSGVQTIT